MAIADPLVQTCDLVECVVVAAEQLDFKVRTVIACLDALSRYLKHPNCPPGDQQLSAISILFMISKLLEPTIPDINLLLIIIGSDSGNGSDNGDGSGDNGNGSTKQSPLIRFESKSWRSLIYSSIS